MLPARIATVIRLLRGGRPAAIAGRVWAIVVDAVDAHTTWARSHVCREGGVFGPALANRDTASAIVFICGVRGVRAALAHVHPYSEQPLVRASGGSTMGGTSLDRLFGSEAPTRRDHSSTKVVSLDLLRSSAVASAQPSISVGEKGRDLFQNGQSTKTSADQIGLSACHINSINHELVGVNL